MNIYFYGGSFDPPHLGHKKIINYFLDKCDKFLIIPTHHSPLKEAQPISYFHRQEMLKLMFSNSLSKKVSIVDYELEIKSRYTADIVRLMKTKFRPLRFFSIRVVPSLVLFLAFCSSE